MPEAIHKNIATVYPQNVGPWQSNPVRHRSRSILREFALNTSTHGLPGIARSVSVTNRIFWSLSFMVFTSIMVFFIIQSITGYFNYPVQTSVVHVVERSQIFPAVTFCNIAPVRSDRTKNDFLNYLYQNNLKNISSTELTINDIQYLPEFFVEVINKRQPYEHYYFTIDDMMIGCNYNGQRCTSNDFISFVSPNHGKCYTFNARTKNMTGKKLRTINERGATGSLTLKVYAYNHLYVPYFADGIVHFLFKKIVSLHRKMKLFIISF